MEQANELLLHFTSAVRTASLAGSHKSLLELGNNFIGGHTAGKQLFQYGFCFSLFGFFCGLFFGSNLFCLCFRKFLCCNLQSGFFAFQLFFQYADVIRQCGDLCFNLFLGCGLFSNNSRIFPSQSSILRAKEVQRYEHHAKNVLWAIPIGQGP